MGEPAIPTPKEREERRALAAAIVKAVAEDEDPPKPFLPIEPGDPTRWEDDALEAAFGLAQEIMMLVDREPGCGRQCPMCSGLGRVETDEPKDVGEHAFEPYDVKSKPFLSDYCRHCARSRLEHGGVA